MGLGKGIKKLHSTVNIQYLIPRNTVEAFLKQQGDYQIQRQVIKNKDNDKIVALRPNQVWVIDVMKLPRCKDDNDDITMLYSIIDVFSRKLWTFILKAETEQLSIELYDDLTSELEVVPKKVITDGGATFARNFKNFVEYNYDRFEPESNTENMKAYEDYRAKYNRRTKHIYGSPYSPLSQSHIERVQMSLRDRIRALIVKKGNFKYVNDIQRLVNNYNTTKHNSTGYTPNELYTPIQYDTTSGKKLAKETLPDFRDDFTKEERITYVGIKEAQRLFAAELDKDKRQKEKELNVGDSVRVSFKAFSNKVRAMYIYKQCEVFECHIYT